MKEYKQLNSSTIKTKNAEYKKLNASTIKTKNTEYRKLNASIIKTKYAEYRKFNSVTIKTKATEKYKLNSATIKTKKKTKYKLNSANITEKYHIQKNLKLDSAEKLREQDPRAHKTFSHSTIKKKVHERFKFGKNFIQVKDYNGDRKRVVGPC